MLANDKEAFCRRVSNQVFLWLWEPERINIYCMKFESEECSSLVPDLFEKYRQYRIDYVEGIIDGLMAAAGQLSVKN